MVLEEEQNRAVAPLGNALSDAIPKPLTDYAGELVGVQVASAAGSGIILETTPGELPGAEQESAIGKALPSGRTTYLPVEHHILARIPPHRERGRALERSIQAHNNGAIILPEGTYHCHSLTSMNRRAPLLPWAAAWEM